MPRSFVLSSLKPPPVNGFSVAWLAGHSRHRVGAEVEAERRRRGAAAVIVDLVLLAHPVRGLDERPELHGPLAVPDRQVAGEIHLDVGIGGVGRARGAVRAQRDRPTRAIRRAAGSARAAAPPVDPPLPAAPPVPAVPPPRPPRPPCPRLRPAAARASGASARPAAAAAAHTAAGAAGCSCRSPRRFRTRLPPRPPIHRCRRSRDACRTGVPAGSGAHRRRVPALPPALPPRPAPLLPPVPGPPMSPPEQDKTVKPLRNINPSPRRLIGMAHECPRIAILIAGRFLGECFTAAGAKRVLSLNGYGPPQRRAVSRRRR